MMRENVREKILNGKLLIFYFYFLPGYDAFSIYILYTYDIMPHFVGGIYSGLVTTINENGILGLWSGVVPRLIGEVHFALRLEL